MCVIHSTGTRRMCTIPQTLSCRGAEEGLGTRLVLVIKAAIVIGALCIPLILTVLAKVVWTHNQT